MPTSILRIALPLLLIAGLPGCGSDHGQKARRELHAAGFAYSVDDFLRAAREGREDIVRQFLAAGMNPDVANASGITAVATAAAGGQGHVVTLLLSRGAKPNAASVEGQTVLLAAAHSGDEQAVRALLAAGADGKAKDSGSQSPLAAAVLEGHPAVVALLVEHAPGLLDDALQLAALKGHTAVMSVLMDRGASPLTVSADGRTPMMYAAENGQLEAVKILRQRGASVTTLDDHLKSAADHAESNGHPDLAAYLRQPDRSADPVQPDSPRVRITEVPWDGEPPASLASLATAITIVDYRSRTLPIAVEDVPDGDTFASVCVLPDEETAFTVAPGDEIPNTGLTVEKVRHRVISPKPGGGRVVNVSEILVRDNATDRPYLVVKGLPAMTGEVCAHAKVPGLDGTCEVRPGDEFRAGSMTVKVADVRPLEIVLERTDTQETVTVAISGTP